MKQLFLIIFRNIYWLKQFGEKNCGIIENEQERGLTNLKEIPQKNKKESKKRKANKLEGGLMRFEI